MLGSSSWTAIFILFICSFFRKKFIYF
ncbi:GlyGly-CTERM sorting domain-containing protein [Vibrio owensii]|uniref:GlyGly-CTERM sorting domain-containing protein n=1 Tax=Vibrio owensii TaxID=696485 RepID=A0ABM6ZMQ3_9VIBR|nr:GlyGly-CTERM sorting domain-containing protein [Vibrio owensii]EGQ9451133.1 GlyGly-CTERM sorting domain-containing protein [Vibrio parahaemolyticus]EGQ9542924.1 GlyGly-CTERM sorting domain-containing protein [Vibrio parahaemolyticus]EGQ9557435.1 GlyGly-CTERM sorting domain-containing protein [Vibrio parahaemolyticus]EGQ9605102.1 GlyGly-CTERM sorting domain-containing protein [Vibrio parahaemolyticus]